MANKNAKNKTNNNKKNNTNKKVNNNQKNVTKKVTSKEDVKKENVKVEQIAKEVKVEEKKEVKAKEKKSFSLTSKQKDIILILLVVVLLVVACIVTSTKKESKVDIELPVAVEGEAGTNGGEPGDLYIEFSVKEDDFYTRDENDIYITVPLTITEAVLGCKKEIPTIYGNAIITIPDGTKNGSKLRLKGKGIDSDINNKKAICM